MEPQDPCASLNNNNACQKQGSLPLPKTGCSDQRIRVRCVHEVATRFPSPNQQLGVIVINRTRSAVMALVVVCALFGAAAASASASTAWVSNTSPVVTGGKSCAQPGFNKVQDAINSGA